MTDQAQSVSVTKNTRSIYDASGFEVFGKHFLAGVGQALGMILVYLIFLALTISLVIRFALPAIQPYLDMYSQSMQSLQTIQSMYAPAEPGMTTTTQETTTTTVTPDQLRQAQDLLQQMQQNNN